jgi:hypothetical protein
VGLFVLCDEKDIILKSLRFEDWFCLCPEVRKEKRILMGRLGKACLRQLVTLVLEDVERIRLQNAAVQKFYAVIRQ